MTLLRWRQKDVGLSVADEMSRARVEACFRTINERKRRDLGRKQDAWIVACVVAVWVVIGVLLMGVLS